MEIIKELNLNGNPQVVTNGSLVFAKNIKISEDGTYITNDDGFSQCFDNSPDSELLRSKLKVGNIKGEKVNDIYIDLITYEEEIDGTLTTINREYYVTKIVGHINCPNEVVFLVYKEYTDYYAGTRTVYKEGEEHNIYRAVEFKDTNKFALFLVPTGWHYDGGIIVGTYTYNVYGHLIIGIAESDADIDKELLTIDLNDSNNDDLLDKYSCAPNVPIANLSLNGKIKGIAMPHGLYYFFIRYEVSDKLYTNWFPIGAPQYALSLEDKTIINHTYWNNGSDYDPVSTTKSALINTNKDSYYNFDFTLTFNEPSNYIGFQIGYILQVDDSTVGRIWSSFALDDNETVKSFTFNGDYIEQIDIEDLTKNVLNLYNVKTLTNYNSKIYAANFKETDYNIDLRAYADNIKTYLIRKVVNPVKVASENVGVLTWTYTIGLVSCSIQVPKDVISIRLLDFIDDTDQSITLLDMINNAIDWGTIPVEDRNIIDLLGTNTYIQFWREGLILKPSKPSGSFGTNTPHPRFFSDYNGYYGFGNKYYQTTPPSGPNIPVVTLNRNDLTINVSSSENTYKTVSTDNIIRSLMPYEVYAFYVHYVRPDGSYTNGIPLENNISINDSLYKKVKDLNETEKIFYDLKKVDENEDVIYDITTIDEIQDKYLYEVYVNIDNEYERFPFNIYINNKGKKLFKTGSGKCIINNNVYLTRLGVRFENILFPPGFVGVFFSYEKVESLSTYQAVVTDRIVQGGLTPEDIGVIIKANDVESCNCGYDGSLFMPQYKINGTAIDKLTDGITYSYINKCSPVMSGATIMFSDFVLHREGTHGGIVTKLYKKDTNNISNDIYTPAKYTVGSILRFNRSIYSNEIKELIAFGPVVAKPKDAPLGYTGVYGEHVDDNRITGWYTPDTNDTAINYDINYPSFLCQDKILTYRRSLEIDENGNLPLVNGNSVSGSEYYGETPYAYIDYIWKFSNLSLSALSFKKEPEAMSGTITKDDPPFNTINIIVRPINITDLFKLESCYIPQIHKAYTNYNERLQTPNVFTNVIRCSYPIRNESGINSWRIFDPAKYYIIDNSNGEIINIFGTGTSFYIHTKNNLLVTSSNAKITADNTTIHLQENNIFDVPPSELFSSELGYGGIKYQICQLFSQYGYIWYDTDRRKLFRFDNGNLVDINSGVDEIIKRYKFEYCHINIDDNSNRIFFSFDNGTDKLTLGYNTLNNKWLSIYDFAYDMSIHTSNVILFANRNGDEILTYDSTINTKPCNYGSLTSENRDFPDYNDGGSDIKYFCFDVILNEEYTTPKVLNSITWVHEVIKQHILNKNHPAEFKLEWEDIDNKVKDLDGVKIIIYSDSVDSGLIDLEHETLNDVANVNNPDGYKYPYYNKGVWNLSYFRNNITIPVTDTELNNLIAQYGVDTVNKLKNIYKVIDRNGNPVYRSSDMRSLIYGKYLTIRFIFITDKRIKFDNIEFNIQKY